MPPRASVKFEFEVYGDVQLRRRLQVISDRAGNMSPALEKVADMLRLAARAQFRSQGRRGGQQWAPLAASTLARKRRLGQIRGILRATDALFKSLTYKRDPNQEMIIQGHALVFRSKLEQHRFHQLGTSKMPARPPLKLTDRDRRDTMRILQRYLMTGRT